MEAAVLAAAWCGERGSLWRRWRVPGVAKVASPCAASLLLLAWSRWRRSCGAHFAKCGLANRKWPQSPVTSWLPLEASHPVFVNRREGPVTW